MINAGKYKHRIEIVKETLQEDEQGFKTTVKTVVLEAYASVKTTKGFTLIVNGSDFEKATTNFTIRYPLTPISRDYIILFKNKRYEIQYINNIDEANIELELQAKEVTH